MTRQRKKRQPVKVLRFMSASEAKAFIRGNKLENYTNHKEQGNKTDSIGFCFMPVTNKEDDGVFWSARRLCGITTTEFCLVGELKHNRWPKGYGVYGDYDNIDADGFAPPIEFDELSTTAYSREDFKHFSFYRPNKLADMELAELPPLVAALCRNSSLPWKEPELFYCTHLDMDCVRSEIRKAKPETVVTAA
jgi:hypothetical protein